MLIEKEIIVNPYISSSVYNFGTDDSKSYVVNEKSHNEFVFDGLASDFWNVILMTQNLENTAMTTQNPPPTDACNNSFSVEKLNKFIIDNSLQDEVDSFLDELYYADLITYGTSDDLYEDILFQNTKLTLINDSEEMNAFTNEKKRYLYNNKYLYSLTFQYSENFNANFAFGIIDDAIKIGVNLVRIDVRNCVLTSEFLSFAKYIREKFLSLELIIDGSSLINERFLCRKVANLYPHRVVIPMFSMDRNIHDSIVKKVGDFDSSIQTIEKLVVESIPVNIYFEQREENKMSFDDILEYTNEMGIEISTNKKIYSETPVLNLVNDEYIDSNEINNIDYTFYARQKLFISEDLKLCINSDYTQAITFLKENSIIDVWNNLIVKNTERK